MTASPEVAQALQAGRPVVALESTIIAHGLPRPQNIAVARELESIVRAEGACPATIAVIDGAVRVGLTDQELLRIATDTDVRKLGLRDLATAMAEELTGATTVSATAFLAARAGIRVFATGGIGGVHRNWLDSWDESADLRVLSSQRITVVCAGVKSILDVPATLQRLETLNVTVVGYRTDAFPGFYLSSSGLPVSWRAEHPEQLATIMSQQDALGISATLLVANPVPESEQLDPDLHDKVLDQALSAAAAEHVEGQAITPFLLGYLAKATNGASLAANLAAVRGNVRLGAQTAVAWSRRADRLPQVPAASPGRASRIDQLTDDIAANRVAGGSAFARAAAELIALRVAQLPPTSSAEDIRGTVKEISLWTADTKPSMAVVRNVADLALSIVDEPGADDPPALRASVHAAMRAFIERSQNALAALATKAGDIVVPGASVLVHSYSASLEALLHCAIVAGTPFRLLVTESRPYRESRRLIEAVAGSPVEIVLYSDAAVCVAAEAADLALVGADSVFTDGSFANKTGSLPLALACRESQVPLYVATELAKLYFGDVEDIQMEMRPAAELSEGWPLIDSGRVQVRNQFFERVDSSLVHRYVTEDGVLSPDQMHTAAARSWQRLRTDRISDSGDIADSNVRR